MNPDSGQTDITQTEAGTAGDAGGADSEPSRTIWLQVAIIAGAAAVGLIAIAFVTSDRGTFCSGDPSPISGEVWLGGGEYVMTARPRHAVLHRPRGLEPLDFTNNLTYVVWLDPGPHRVEGGPLEYRCAPLPRGWVGGLRDKVG